MKTEFWQQKMRNSYTVVVYSLEMKNIQIFLKIINMLCLCWLCTFLKCINPLFSKKKKKLRPPIQFDCRWPIFLRLRTCTCKQNVALKHFRDSQRSFVGIVMHRLINFGVLVKILHYPDMMSWFYWQQIYQVDFSISPKLFPQIVKNVPKS